MRVSIIGGGGRVGSCAAYALQCAGIVSEIVLFDVLKDVVEGEVLDLIHGSSLMSDQRICSGDMGAAAGTDLIVITAGLRRKPDESRLDLINRNVSLFLSILHDLKEAGLGPDAILLVVSNPVDILTQLALERSGLPPKQVIGLGTLLDSVRFSSLIAEAIRGAPTQVKALILGEHGDSMVPIWSSATYNGFWLGKHPALSALMKNGIFERTRQSGAEIIRLKGGAGWAVGTSIRAVVDAIALDQRRMLPISSMPKGAYGVSDVCLSVPTILGRRGIVEHTELDLWPREIQALKKSAHVLNETLKRIRS